MGRAPRRPRRASEHDPQDVGMLVLVGDRAKAQQVIARSRSEPAAHIRGRTGCVTLAPLESRERLAEIVLEPERIVRSGLHTHQQAVERRDVDTGGVETALERLDERRSRTGERIEHPPARRHVTAEELLDELRHVFPEIRDAGGGRASCGGARGGHALGPRQVEIEALVDLLLGARHDAEFAVGRGSFLERVRQVLDPAGPLGDHIEANVEPSELLVAA